MLSARVPFLLTALLCVTGCKKETPEVAAPTAPAATATAQDPMVGVVAERLDAPNYTYLRLTRASMADVWVAVPTTATAVGTQVRVMNASPMENFESKTLGRTFPMILFSSGVTPVGGEGQAAAPAAPAAPAPVVATPTPAPSENPKVDKATGADAHTVAEIYAQRLTLKGQPVSVRAQVVKVTSGVLGRNWLHLRDGSGSEGTQDFDLIITTTETAKVNDIVTVQGAVTVDKDLGSGYAYKVLIEDAKLVP